MNPKLIAFYLPQYYPVKENNEWFGEGFTEWTNVAKAKPLFRGHDQPRIPRDLGFYDLRLPEVRAKQADLAKEACIDAFCYYHYWFGEGKVMLEKPIQEVVRLGKPDFPFCLCWANHSWYRKLWNPNVKSIEQSILIKQTYPGEADIINHFNFLLPIFKDKRYFKVEERLLFVIYNILDIPNFTQFKTIWNKLALENGLPEFYFLANTVSVKDIDNKVFSETDGTILSLHSNIQNKQDFSFTYKVKSKLRNKIADIINYPLSKYKYSDAIKYFLDPVCKREDVIPVLTPNWDYTPRRGAGGLILTNATPALFGEHIRQTFEMIQNKPEKKQLVFIKSWNEWGEGNYMEPDLTYGKGYIEVLRKEVELVKKKIE